MEKKKPERERTGEKERESAGDFFTEEGRSAGDLNEGEKEKEGVGIEIQRVWRR